MLFLSVIIFKEVNLVNRRVWVDKDLASQRNLLKKLLKKPQGSFLKKPLNEASRGSYRKLPWYKCFPAFVNRWIFSKFGLQLHKTIFHDLTVGIFETISGVC